MKMKQRHWFFFVLLPLALSWTLDRATKLFAIDHVDSLTFFGFIGFVKHHNYGAMLGLFSDLPPVLRVVSLSTGGAFLIFIFFVIQYLLPSRLIVLRTGLSILLGGILGNVADRIAWSYIVDFIVIGNAKTTTPAFNVADMIQWIGYVMIVYSLIKDGKKLWPENDSRKMFLVNPQFQIKYSIKLMLLGLAFAVISAVYTYTYMKVTIIDLVGHQAHIEDKFLIPFLLTFAIVSTAFIIFLFFVGLVLSHRAAGPLYAFEKFLEDLSKGKVRALKLRAGDEFQHLEELAEKLGAKLTTMLEKGKDSK
jgi:signal peptidase II